MNAARTEAIDEHGSIDAEPGSKPWAIAVRREAQSALNAREFSSKQLQSWMDLLRDHKGYRQLGDRKGRPFATFEAFCTERQPFGLGYHPGHIDQIIAERKEAEAKDLALMFDRKAINAGDGPLTKDESSNLDIIKVSSLSPGTSAEYLAARIARDHPEIHERMKAGEFKSVRRAALEAGILKPTVSLPLDPQRAARILVKHLPPADVKALIIELSRAAGFSITHD